MALGGKREGAGRKKNIIPKYHHNIAFTKEDWDMIRNNAPSERKVADFIVEAVKFYINNIKK